MDLDRPHPAQSSNPYRQSVDHRPIAIHTMMLEDTKKE